MAEVDVSQLLPWLQDATYKDQSNALTTQSKATNNSQDIIKLLFDPQFAALIGGYDPMLAVDQAPPVQPYPDNLPLTQMYLTSGADPTMSMIVAGLLSDGPDRITPIAAKRMVMEAAAAEGGELSGMDPIALSDSIDAVVKEITDNQTARTQWDQEQAQIQTDYANKPRDDIFSRAGLPSPLERYSAETIPLPEDIAQRNQWLGGAAENAASAYEKYLSGPQSRAKGPTSTRMVDRGSHSAVAGRDGVEQMAAPIVPWTPQEEARHRAQGDGPQGLPQKKDGDILDSLVDAVVAKGKLDAAPGSWKQQQTQTRTPVKPDKQKQALLNEAMKQQGLARDSTGFARGYAKSAQSAGRSPLSDAIERRKQFAAMLGVI
jgi:hypothetical protein